MRRDRMGCLYQGTACISMQRYGMVFFLDDCRYGVGSVRMRMIVLGMIKDAWLLG